ncbi:hypothetical protein LDENG_00126680 [Lucifuga dentata]|nr:hypothetical protein LDENG_00126680 [Lucifuga dentata]
MELEEENGVNVGLKRQRAPLSDSEDNVPSTSEMNDSQKRRRLEVAGQENRSPKPSSSGRLFELEMKPDTPIVPSVRSRVQQLTQRPEGALLAQRCLSDPGGDTVSATIHEKGFREHILSDGEFNQRMERFKAPVIQARPAPTPDPASSCPRTLSNFVSGIQQKLQGTATPSSKQASRIRQEREQELSQLHFQPITENAWLKRSNSDSSLTQQVDDNDAEMKDGSFSEFATSSAAKLSVKKTGNMAACETEASAELESCNEGELQPEFKTHQCRAEREEKEHKASAENEVEQLGTHQADTQTVLDVSINKDKSFTKASLEDQSVSQPIISENEILSDEKQSLHKSTLTDETRTTQEVSRLTEEGGSEVFSFEEGKGFEDFSYCEEEIEPSTDEELRVWRYPQDKVYEEGESATAEEERVEGQAEQESSRADKERQGGVADHTEVSEIQDRECPVNTGYAEMQEDMKSGFKEEHFELEICLDDVKSLNNQKETEAYLNKDDKCQQSQDIQTLVIVQAEGMDLKSNITATRSRGEQMEQCHFTGVAQAEPEIQRDVEHQRNDEAKADADPADGVRNDGVLANVKASEHVLETVEMAWEAAGGRQRAVADGTTCESHIEEADKAERRESLKKVTFVLEPEVIGGSALSEMNISIESAGETSLSEAELSSHEETNTSDIIDQMFTEVLEYAERLEEERGIHEDMEDHDSGIGTCSGDKDKMDTESEKEKNEEEQEAKEEKCDESNKLENNGDELLTFPPSGILSPLSKSVEAVVTPLRLAASQQSNPPSLLLSPEETATSSTESAPLYSIDAYRTQRQSKLPTIQSVTPGVQRRAPEKSRVQPSVNTKDKIAALNEEAGKLQTVISQTLQALSCCTDEEHGRGSLEEAEAEKLLLISCEKRSALLAEVSKLREERSSESDEAAAGEDRDYVSQQPCRGNISITNIQLPLKVEFVCSSRNRTGRPSHYFFVLIRYGPCNIVATPLATAADAQNGDTISFPTSVTLKDIRSNFEIDVEVYSLSHTSASSCSSDRTSTKSRVTPRKLLNTITRSSNNMTAAALPALNPRRSSNFFLVGSHKITLASLGQSKFPLDKMKLEGKIRRLLGDEFQEKVPFLSPLEGNIYLQLDSQSHSNVQHQGFLTMFDVINGFGVWHRRYFMLEGCHMYYWNHPNDKETKEAEGSISLSSSSSQCVKPVKRDSCARPFTFELVSNIPAEQHGDSQDTMSKCWFSADTKQERLDWMEKLNQVLLDIHTWSRASGSQAESQQSKSFSSESMRESVL